MNQNSQGNLFESKLTRKSFQYTNKVLALLASYAFPTINSGIVFSIFVDSNKDTWLYRMGENFPLFRCNSMAKRWSSQTLPAGENLIANIQQKESVLWISRDHSSIMQYNLVTQQLNNQIENSNTDFPIKDNSIMTLLMTMQDWSYRKQNEWGSHH